MKLSLGINKKFGVCPECQNELYFKLGKLTSKPLPMGECCKRELNRLLTQKPPPQS